MVDVVLPVLDEREALPRVLGAFPPGYRADRRRQRLDRRLGRARRASSAPRSSREERKGFGAACFAGLVAAPGRRRLLHGLRRLARPAATSPRVADPVGAGDADLVLGARALERGAMPPHARVANRVLALELRRRAGVRVTDLGPMRAARRDALLALGIEDRRFGWPLEMVLRAARAGWRIEEVPVPYRRAAREVEDHRDRARHAAHRARHARGPQRGMRRTGSSTRP